MRRQANRWTGRSWDNQDEPIRSIHFDSQSVPLSRRFERPYGRPQEIDLEFLNARPQMARALADTFWVELESGAEFSRQVCKCSLKTFFAFLDWSARKYRTDIVSFRDITFELLGRFPEWLMGQRKVSERTAQSVYSSVTHHLSATRRLHPQDFPLDFEIPPHGLRKTRSGRRADCLSEDIFGEIIHAAELQANVIQDRYGPGDFPKRGTDLIPFMILIAANTAMNAFSLYGLRRTCLQDHPIDEHGVYLIWKKARSSKGIQKQLHWRRLSPTIKLIRFVIDYTEPLVEWAPAPLQEFLFLYQYTHHKSHRSRVVSMKHFQNHLKSLGSFREKNALPHFTFGQIRPSVATHNHLKNGGNLRKTQMLLGHKDIETTETYINKRIVEPLYNKSIRSAQEAMVNTITVIPKRAEEAVAELTPGLTPAQSKRIIRGEFSTGLCRCRNPLNSPQPGQRKGHMCTLFLACLTCPNALFFQEDLPRVIAFANHLNSLKKTMSKQTWDELYSKQLRILDEEIIGAFSEKDIADAKLKSSAITDMSLLMNDNLSA